jgi:type I restriction enzyme, R subunit
MTDVGQPERKAQEHIIKLLCDRLGYRYLGNWEYRAGNANVEVELLTQNLKARGYSDNLINRAITKLQSDASLGGGRDLYEANHDVYGLLRYGVKVKPGIGEQTETVWLIDWNNPAANDFALAEEVTVTGQNTKRPDIVLYVNGVALVTLELKRSTVAVSEGIRQTIGNQKQAFIRQFFTTVQLVMAGNDVEGLSYTVIDTSEKYWLNWRLIADVDPATRAQLDAELVGVDGRLDQALVLLAAKHRLLEIVHDFIVFDSGIKKTARPNQYFGVKAAQARVTRREGGIIWHTQGSGKSLTMVWLAKWIREHQQDARVVLITDRTELDEQIEGVFLGVNEKIYRTNSGIDMLDTLNKSAEWLICSLIHKFRGSDSERDKAEAADEFIRQLRLQVPEGFSPKGNIFVFVDEAHRTQTGKMHDTMKQLLPDAMFIGFTGTPLLKSDKATSFERFGSFVHTYKFDEAVQDGVVLDLRYEARDIEQHLTSPDKVDKWFDAKTKGMTDLSRAELKKRWGTMQKVVSSEPRAKQIVTDILLDMATKPRLMDARGNAILVSSSIYQACTFYRLFRQAGFQGKCAIVTSYEPQPGDISKEDSGQGMTEKLLQYETYRQMLADHFSEPADTAMHKVEKFEQDVKKQFIEQPGQMRLLIVVDKLLTGFDAPPATYLYIDKTMRDHGLFQAICRVNRLDGDDKDYGYVVDYRDLFNSLEKSIKDYTTGALDGYEKQDIEGLLSDRLHKARQDLDEALEKIRAICERVEPPKNTLQYQRYFCATEPGDAEQLKANEPKRVELYKAVASVVRAFGNLANEMDAADYSPTETSAIKAEIAHYVSVRDEVKLGAGENIDFKQYEPDMRFLLDTYIQADASETVADFGDAGLVQLIVRLGLGAIDKLPNGIKSDPDAVAETIANNVRKLIIDERPTNPKYYDRMSELLKDLIRQRQQEALDYKEYLEKLIALTQQVGTQKSDATYPAWADTGAKRALFDFGWPDEQMAILVDQTIMHTKLDRWVGDPMKERKVKRALRHVVGAGYERFDELFDLIKARDEYR